jgi:hypothetical protein
MVQSVIEKPEGEAESITCGLGLSQRLKKELHITNGEKVRCYYWWVDTELRDRDWAIERIFSPTFESDHGICPAWTITELAIHILQTGCGRHSSPN